MHHGVLATSVVDPSELLSSELALSELDVSALSLLLLSLGAVVPELLLASVSVAGTAAQFSRSSWTSPSSRQGSAHPAAATTIATTGTAPQKRIPLA